MLRIEVHGLLHDWFDVDEMGDLVKASGFSNTLRENIARYFGVPVAEQAIYDEDGLIATAADLSRALQRYAPKLYVYNVNEIGTQLREKTSEQLKLIDLEVERTRRSFRPREAHVGAEMLQALSVRELPGDGQDQRPQPTFVESVRTQDPAHRPQLISATRGPVEATMASRERLFQQLGEALADVEDVEVPTRQTTPSGAVVASRISNAVPLAPEALPVALPAQPAVPVASGSNTTLAGGDESDVTEIETWSIGDFRRVHFPPSMEASRVLPTASVPSHEEVRASASPSVHKTVAAVPLTSIASGGVSISASNASTALSSRTPTSSAPRPAPRAPEPLPTMGAATDSLQFVGQCQVQLPSSVVQGEAQPPRPQVEAVAESLFALGPRVEARVFVEEDSCPACGTSYLPDSVFCRNCGRKRDQAPQSTARLSGRQELVPQSSAPLSRAQEVPPQSSVHLSRAQEVKPQGTPRLSRAQVSTRTMARNSSEGPRSLSPPMRPLSAPRNLSREALPWTPSPAQRGYPNFVFQPSGPASPQPVKFAPQPLSPGPPGIMRAVSPLVRPLQPLPLNSPAVRRTISGPKSKGDTVYVAQNSCRTAAVRTTGVVQDIGWR